MIIDIIYVGASTCIIDIDSKFKIGIDPALKPKGTKINFKSFTSFRIKNPKFKEENFEKIDLWLITHSHEDHLDNRGLEKIKKYSKIISDKKTKNKFFKKNKKAYALKWNKLFKIEKEDIKVRIKAIPAYHGSTYIMRKIIGKVNGYLIEAVISDKVVKIYLTGDTVYHKKITAKIPNKIDIFIPNMGEVMKNKKGGPITMNLEMLEKFVVDINPNTIIPVHIDDYGHYEMKKDDFSFKKNLILKPGENKTFKIK